MYKLIGADGKEYGPVSADQLRQWISEGRANYETSVLTENAVEWRPLGAFAEFAAALAAATPPATFRPLYSGSSTRTNGMAIAGFVLGLFSVFSCICCCVSPPSATLGLIFSCLSLSQINANPQQTGRSMAITGLVLSILGLLLSLGFMFVVFSNGAGDTSTWMNIPD